MTKAHITINSAANQEAVNALLASSFEGTVLEGKPGGTEEEYAEGVLVSSDRETCTFSRSDLPQADDSATDGSARVYRYDVPAATVFVEINEMYDALHIYPAGTSIKTLLREFETGDFDMAEHLASWGYDGTPEEADADAIDVRVWCEPCYYAGSLGSPIGHYVVDERRGDVLVFETVADAQEWIDAMETGVYVLSSGEAGRPAYTICE